MLNNKKSSSIPYIIWSIAFVIVPLVLVLVFAFTNKHGEFTFSNIEKIGTYADIFVKSINLAIIATIICFLIGYPLAFIISRANNLSQKNLLLLVMLPMWMNFLLRTYGWMTLLENEGIINKVLGFIGLGPFEMINTQGAVVLGMVYNYLPFMVLPLYSIMVKIDRSVIEAAQDLGANWLQILGRVLLPLSMPGIISGLTMVLVPSISTFIISKMLGGGSNMLIGDLIESQFLGGSYNPYLGSAISLILMIIMLLIMGVINSLEDDEMEGMLV
ncbi:ABC transporter permease [Paludicola sp. MB14-C6]|uniref:ABC transporter permease n=1 Tax=Paludihabitans sp. MB14-C6 TaxID=3070656 RepID=UPI0027DC8C81|nr:ABC transporter permease [Paludicola sp. MB14-C6]WMJ23655.1 ABC transporter permease [Paludicola sp. MB14-C6]